MEKWIGMLKSGTTVVARRVHGDVILCNSTSRVQWEEDMLFKAIRNLGALPFDGQPIHRSREMEG